MITTAKQRNPEPGMFALFDSVATEFRVGKPRKIHSVAGQRIYLCEEKDGVFTENRGSFRSILLLKFLADTQEEAMAVTALSALSAKVYLDRLEEARKAGADVWRRGLSELGIEG